MKKHYLILILFAASSMLPACSKKSSDMPLPDKGTFTFAGAVYSGPTTSATYNGGVEVNIAGAGGMNLVLYNLPSASGGSFNVYNAFDTGVLQSSTDVYASSNILIANLSGGSVSASGTLTKTGARSFTFTGFFRADLSGAATAIVSASGNY
jgi:hypothetical protein